MANKRPLVAGIGELLWDVFPDGKKPGGAPANFAWHAQGLGAESFIVSALGNDSPGKDMLQVLGSLSLNQSYIQLSSLKETGVVNVTLTDGIPQYEIKKGAAWDFICWEPGLGLLAAKTDAVCYGSLAQRSEVSRQTILKFLGTTRGECLRVFDINMRQDFYSAEVIKKSLELASVLKLNDEELPVVADIFSIKGSESLVLETLLKRFSLKLIALTKAEKGSLLVAKNETSAMEAPKVQVKDTVGAGDSFTATMVYMLLKGHKLGEVHKAANRVAAYVCSCMGATPVLPPGLIESLA